MAGRELMATIKDVAEEVFAEHLAAGTSSAGWPRSAGVRRRALRESNLLPDGCLVNAVATGFIAAIVMAVFAEFTWDPKPARGRDSHDGGL